MAKSRVPLFQREDRSIWVEEGATVGATFGLNLWITDPAARDGRRLLTLADLPGGTGTGTGGGQQVGATTWPLVLDKPPNIIAVAALATAGIVVRKADGSWLTRTIEAVAGETTSAEEDGATGNPTIGLADVTPGSTATLLATAFDAKGRRSHQRAANAADVGTALGYDPLESVVAGDCIDVDLTDPINPIISSTAIPAQTWLAGVYQQPFIGAQSGTRVTLSPIAGRLYCMPGYVLDRITISAPVVEVVAGVALATCRVGLVSLNPATLAPIALLADFGTADCSVTGTRSVTGGATSYNLVPEVLYGLIFLSASTIQLYYQPHVPLGVPRSVSGVGPSILSIYAAGKSAQLAGGFTSSPTPWVAADVVIESAANGDGYRCPASFVQVPT